MELKNKYIYLIKNSNNSKYKIGVSSNPDKRIKQLQTGNSDELILLNKYSTNNYNKVEIALHNRFSYAKNIGEWFDLSLKEEIEFLEICKKIDKNINYLNDNNVVNREFLI